MAETAAGLPLGVFMQRLASTPRRVLTGQAARDPRINDFDKRLIGRPGASNNIVPDVPEGVPYFRVQGGQGARPGQVSQERSSVNSDGTVSINPGCTGQLCVSIEGPDHAAYYLSNSRPDGTVLVFEVDRATHNWIMEVAVEQQGSRGAPVQITDPNTPVVAIQLDDAFADLMANGSSNGRVISQQEFFDEFGGN